MLNQASEDHNCEHVEKPSTSTDDGIFTDEDTSCSNHRPVEVLKRRDRSISENSQVFGNSTLKSRTLSEDLGFSEETNKKFAKLSGAYEELCKQTITLVHTQSDANMFNNNGDHEDVFQSCDTVHDLPSKSSTNNLLPQFTEGNWKHRHLLDNSTARKRGRDSVTSTSLKPSYQKSITKLITRMIIETLVSFVRNIGCYIFIICFITIVVIHPQPALLSRADYEIDVILLLVGSLIVSWQILNIIKQTFKFKVSAIQDILKYNLTDAEEFEEIIRQKRSTPPYLTLEMKVKKLSSVACFLFSCCTCCRRGMDNLWPKRHCTILHYDNWFDASYVEYRKANRKSSTGVSEEANPQSRVFQGTFPSTPHMVIISKDCRLVDQTTSSSIEQESKTIKTLFSDDLELDESHIRSEINVDVQEGLRFPDVEAFLILDTQVFERGKENSKKCFARHPFFSSKMLLIFSILALDSLYYTIFLFKCLSPTRFCIVKYVKRNALSSLAEESSDHEST